MNGGEERFGVFGVSCGDAPPSFEHQECIFNQMAELIELFVIRSLYDAVFLGRDNGFHALRSGLLKDRVGIIRFIREKVIGVYALNQF